MKNGTVETGKVHFRNLAYYMLRMDHVTMASVDNLLHKSCRERSVCNFTISDFVDETFGPCVL